MKIQPNMKLMMTFARFAAEVARCAVSIAQVLAAASKRLFEVPRSDLNIGKEILSEKYVRINQTNYFRRTFECGTAELVRFDQVAGKWVFLCFK